MDSEETVGFSLTAFNRQKALGVSAASYSQESDRKQTDYLD
jgi:hypothetical protein